MLLTSAECLTHAEEKLAEAGQDDGHRSRLTTAAEGWLALAGQLRRLERTPGTTRPPPKRRRKSTSSQPSISVALDRQSS